MPNPAGIKLNAAHRATLARAMKDRTQTDVAAAAGIPQPQLSAMLGGQKNLSDAKLRRLCKVLGLSCRITRRADIAIRS